MLSIDSIKRELAELGGLIDSARSPSAVQSPTASPSDASPSPRSAYYINPAKRSILVSSNPAGIAAGRTLAASLDEAAIATARTQSSTSTAATSSSSLQDQLRAINQAQLSGVSIHNGAAIGTAVASQPATTSMATTTTGDNLYARAEVYRLKKEEARKREEEMAKNKAKPQLNP